MIFLRILLVTFGVLAFIISAFLLGLGTLFDLNEDQIIKDSIEGFTKAQYDQRVFDNRSALKGLVDYLIVSVETISIESTRTNDSKQIKKRGDSPCCYIGLSQHSTHSLQMTENIRNHIDEVLKELGFISGIKVCSKGHFESENKEYGSAEIYIDHMTGIPRNHNYRIQHKIYLNKTFKEQLESIYGKLQKETFLTNEIKYSITVWPYSGW